MAGSRRSPVLRDPRSGDPDSDPRDRDRRRGRGSNRDRGRSRHRDRGGRQSRPNDRHSDYPTRSPPSRASRLGPDTSRTSNDHLLDRSPPRGSPGPSSSFRDNRRPDPHRISSSGDLKNTHPFGGGGKDIESFRRDDSPFGPPYKRKRTRSPSPRGQRPPFPQRRSSFANNGDRRDRSPPARGRGHLSGRGGPRGRSPYRGRDRRGKDRRRPDMPRLGRSRSPVRDREFRPSPGRRPRSPTDDYSDRDFRYRSRTRSLSRHSARSVASKASVYSSLSGRNEGTHLARPIKSGMNDHGRSPSPSRRFSNLNGSNMDDLSKGQGSMRDASPMREMRPADVHSNQRRRPSRPDKESGSHSTSPHLNTPTRSHHGSPQPESPYAGRRGGWKGVSGHSPYHRRDGHYIQSVSSEQYHQAQHGPSNGATDHHSQSSHSGPSRRGGSSDHRGNQASHGSSRRFSGSGPNGLANRGGRGHFNSAQWTASGPYDRGGPSSPHITRPQTPPSRPQSINDPQSPHAIEPENRPKPAGRAFQEDDDKALPALEEPNAQNMLPPNREPQASTPADKSGKFSFAFKAKTTPTPAPKPVPDLAQRMRVREPPPRAPAADPPTPRNRLTNGPMPTYKPKPEPRFDRRDRDRDRGRDRGRDARDRRDFRDQRDARDRRDFHGDPRNQREDRRPDNRRERRKHDRRLEAREDRRKELSPEPPRVVASKQKKILTRIKPRPTIPEEFATSDSIYYRKPGNESVIGAGTYGKVFKGIHVYTQRKVALKKIRMEGEKDGFPVTAVREIKLLQHLRNNNVVSLLEVMVERNECFMVFEYLSHDLTGLINHPTFSLTLPHKKDLAKQMFEGLSYLHHRGVLHRDIKAANILISNTGLLKYADFGLARFYSKSRQLDYTNRVITIWYRPPELLLGETRYGPGVDVWSAACVCMEMFTKKAVFPGEGSELSQLDKIYNTLGTPTRDEWPDIVEMPWFQLMRSTERKNRVFEEHYRDSLTPAALDMITQVFRYDPVKRPSADEVLKHPFFVSEEPAPQQAIELEHIEGDWHEFESKAHRKEARRVEQQSQKDREKRKAEASVPSSDRDSKRVRAEGTDQTSGHA